MYIVFFANGTGIAQVSGNFIKYPCYILLRFFFSSKTVCFIKRNQCFAGATPGTEIFCTEIFPGSILYIFIYHTGINAAPLPFLIILLKKLFAGNIFALFYQFRQFFIGKANVLGHPLFPFECEPYSIASDVYMIIFQRSNPE